MKRQVGIVVSIALVSFLAGTLFNMNYMAIGSDTKPWDKVWQAIYELQSRVDSLNATVIEQQAQISELQSKVDSLNASLVELQGRVNTTEEKLNQSKMMRFVDVSEHEISNVANWRDVTVFTWVPQDKSNNALFYVSYYFEYSKKVPDPTRLLYKLLIWNASAQIWAEVPTGVNDCFEDYAWNPMRYYVMSLYPNQDAYIFKSQATVDFGIAYVRNINIFITVEDGLQASG